MTKRVFIVHGWSGYPEEGWFPWLKAELEKHGFSVYVPQLPDAGTPRKELWVPALASAVGVADGDTYFVGHSMGCQTIARYLETLPDGVHVGGAVFVAGFFTRLTGLDESEMEIAAPWLNTPIDFRKVRSHIGSAVAFFSDNDPYVPLENKGVYDSTLGCKVIVEHNKGHFSGSEGVMEVPGVLSELLHISK